MTNPNFLHHGEHCRLNLGVADDQGTR